ncbi:hypothetical protein VPHPG9A1_0043 [Vibrio phage PG9A-1]
MIEQLVKERARSMYSEAAQRVRDAAIEEANKLGLGHNASGDLIKYVLADNPKVPDVAESHLMRSIVSGIELTLTGQQECEKELERDVLPIESAPIEKAPPPVPEPKDMKVAELRVFAELMGIKTKTDDGKNVPREDLEAEILAKQG